MDVEKIYEAGYSKGERFTAMADEWVEANPIAWNFIVNEAVSRSLERRRFGIGELTEMVRWHMKAQGVDDFKVNNSYRAPLARRLIREHPECKEFIRTRSSCVDLLND